MDSVEANQARLRSMITVLNPVLVAERLDQAFEHFVQEYAHVPREETIAMWTAAGGERP